MNFYRRFSDQELHVNTPLFLFCFVFFSWGQFGLQPENGPQAVYFLVISTDGYNERVLYIKRQIRNHMRVIITWGLIWTPVRVRVKRCYYYYYYFLKKKKKKEKENIRYVFVRQHLGS